MTTTLVLSFPLGRYHATPWGRHVNEGAVEIPPSPWRLLRALYAVWQTRLPNLPETVVHSLLSKLATPPIFFIPQHTLAHTRHYYPDSIHRTGKNSTDNTLDAFAVFEPDAEIAARWPGSLDDAELRTLAQLAEAIPYFGRADSICEGRLDKDWKPNGHDVWSPLDVADTVDERAEAATVLAPEVSLQFDALVSRPVDVRRDGRLFPPGTRFVGYQRTAGHMSVTASPSAYEKVTSVRFSILQAGLPPETDTLIYTDLLRQAALNRLGTRPDGTLLGGKDAANERLSGQHQHAHFIPTHTYDRRLSGFVVWAPAGLPEPELKALMDVHHLRSPVNENWRLTVRAAGMGDLADVAPELAGPATTWLSATPFTPSRYPKKNAQWTEFLADEIVRELSYRNLPAPESVTLVPGDWASFRRYRPSARFRQDRRQGQANRAGAFLRLTFARPVSGPLGLGHLSHFGLGLFHPMK